MTVLYRIRVKRPDLEVEVESTDRAYVDSKLDQYLNTATAPELPTAGGRAGARVRPPASISEFLRQVSPVKKNEVAATIAYFLEFHADPPLEDWKPEQIAAKFPEVRKTKPANMTDLLAKSGFFMGLEKGFYRLSEDGVLWVEGRVSDHES